MTEKRHEQDSYAIHLENQRRLEAWKARKKAEAERAEREQKQAALQSYLHRREQEWRDHTGTLPPYDLRAQWTQEYMAGVAAEQELELELRRQAAIEESYNFQPGKE